MNPGSFPVEQFPPLSVFTGIIHGFTLRVAGIQMSHDKREALARLDGVHRRVLNENGLGEAPLITAQQVHGVQVGVIERIAWSLICQEYVLVFTLLIVAPCFWLIQFATRSVWCIPAKKGRNLGLCHGSLKR